MSGTVSAALVLASAEIAQEAGDVAFDRILARQIRDAADTDIAVRFLRELAEAPSDAAA